MPAPGGLCPSLGMATEAAATSLAGGLRGVRSVPRELSVQSCEHERAAAACARRDPFGKVRDIATCMCL